MPLDHTSSQFAHGIEIIELTVVEAALVLAVSERQCYRLKEIHLHPGKTLMEN